MNLRIDDIISAAGVNLFYKSSTGNIAGTIQKNNIGIFFWVDEGIGTSATVNDCLAFIGLGKINNATGKIRELFFQFAIGFIKPER